MAKRRVKQAVTTPNPMMTPPTARFELPDGLPDGLPQPGKPITLTVDGTLTSAGLKEYPGDRDSIRVRIGKVTVKGK